jgi:hypothetical protein
MKIPAKNWIIALLAVAAVVVMAWQTLHPHRSNAAAPIGTKPLPTPLANTPAKPAPAVSPEASVQVTAIDRAYVEAHLAGWLDEPQHDPFFKVKPVAPPPQTNRLSQFTLKAIWRQSGVSMAAINHGVYRAGDLVEGCKILSMDDSRVWLEVNGQKEQITFATPAPVKTPKPAAAKLKNTKLPLETTNATPDNTAAMLENAATALKNAAAAMKPAVTATN